MDNQNISEDGSALVVYKGYINQDILMPIVQLTERNMELHQEDQIMCSKVLNVLVELLQNTYKHGLKLMDQRYKEGELTIVKEGAQYHIALQNYVDTSKENELTTYINKLSSMEKEALDVLYVETLKKGFTGEDKGAGLGLIDVFRSNYSKVDCAINSNEANKTIFTINVIIE